MKKLIQKLDLNITKRLLEFQEIKEKNHYNPLLISKNAPFTQAWFFGEWQEMIGRRVKRFEITENSETIGFFQTIKYPLPFGQSFLYIPHGPVIKDTNNIGNIFFGVFKEKMLEIGQKYGASFVKLDLFPAASGSEKYFKKTSDYAYNSAYFQPKYEWILNIEKSEKEIMAGMHPKTRYNIRLGENKNVKIEIIKNNFQKYFNNFYDLARKTAKRNNFSLHPEIYYKNIFVNCEKNENAFLVAARFNDKILAVNLILLYGETAYFIFGGSSDGLKNLMAPHLAHWQAIIEAKTRGFKVYNFGAVGDDKFKGISRFKKGFGGQLSEYSDSYDLVLKPFWYYLYNLKKRFL